MIQRDTDHLRLKSTHAQRDMLFIANKKLFLFLQQPASIYDKWEKAIPIIFCAVSVICTAYCIIFAWGSSDLIWLCITVHLFEPWKNSLKKPTLTIFSSKATNECMCPMWHFFLWLLKDKRGIKCAVPKGHQKTQLKLLNTGCETLSEHIKSCNTILESAFFVLFFYPPRKDKWDWGKANSPNYILLCQLMLTAEIRSANNTV